MAINGVSAQEISGVAWRKSSASVGDGNCVEFARLEVGGTGDVAVRNSRFPDGPALVFTASEIRAMLVGVKAGEFDDLA